MNELEMRGLRDLIKEIVKEELDERSFGDAEEYPEEPEDTEEDIDNLPSGSEVSKEEMEQLQKISLTPEQRAKGGETTKKKQEAQNTRDQEDELEDADEDSDEDIGDDESEYEDKE